MTTIYTITKRAVEIFITVVVVVAAAVTIATIVANEKGGAAEQAAASYSHTAVQIAFLFATVIFFTFTALLFLLLFLGRLRI